jgi:23S rRNA pseudouridine1911/1915/1917 synthase
MERIITYKITEADEGMDVHSFLRRKGYSRHILASMKPDPEAVLLNGTHVYMRHPVTPGDTLRIRLRDEESSETLIPAPIPFSIVYEDEDLLVIDKPVNEAIHPAISHPADTLGNGLAYYFSMQNIPFVFRCINRLDRDTTGLLIVAKNLLAASVLEQSLQRREIHRTYLAVAEGLLPDEGTIDLPIARVDGSLILRAVDHEHGVRAVTHYRTLRRIRESDMPAGSRPFPGLSVLMLRLETGRTHQIRVHLAYLGHPLAGDPLYNPHCLRRDVVLPPPGTGVTPKDDHPLSLTRQALHSWKLDFTHPVTGAPMHFEAPVPDDMRRLIEPDFSGDEPMTPADCSD